ncbi:hypothetical protein [Novipirellula maiorica]|nr:hypothetical protein [Rhodopirellula maiorica]
MKKITVENYKQDKYYEKVVRAMAAVLERQENVSPIDVMLQLQRLTPKQVEDWRFARIAYLERVASRWAGDDESNPSVDGVSCARLKLDPIANRLSQVGQGQAANHVTVLKIGRAEIRGRLVAALHLPKTQTRTQKAQHVAYQGCHGYR